MRRDLQLVENSNLNFNLFRQRCEYLIFDFHDRDSGIGISIIGAGLGEIPKRRIDRSSDVKSKPTVCPLFRDAMVNSSQTRDAISERFGTIRILARPRQLIGF